MSTDPKFDVEALAVRCESAEGPDRELDCLIWCALNGVTNITYPTEGHPMTPGRSGRVEATNPDGGFVLLGWIDPGEVQRNWRSYGSDNAYPHVTGSLDAAMSLVPEGCGWLVGYGRTRPDEPMGGAAITRKAATENISEANDIFAEAEAPTPALALCAAALRARANGIS